MPKKIIEIKLEQMAFGGEALGDYEGKKIFVAWGVPGDLLKVELVEEKRDYSRAKIVEILEPSIHRVEAECPYFFKCGGCQWQHIRYESQILFKQDLLKTALQRTGKISDPKILEAILAPQAFHYRSKIRLQLSKEGILGFYKNQTQEVVEISSCLIAQDVLNEKIPQARSLGQQIIAKDQSKLHEIEIFSEEGKKVQVREVDEETHFVQSNSLQNLNLKKCVKNSLELSGKEKVLELFAGNGNFTFDICSKAQEVVAVESNTQAIISAEEKIRKGHFKNVEFMESSAYRYLSSLPKEKKFDRILLDPPRNGMEQGIDKLAQLKAPKIVYVSCDPATLARDVRSLMSLGYQHESSQLIDMFPQTYHIESITCLSLQKHP